MNVIQCDDMDHISFIIDSTNVFTSTMRVLEFLNQYSANYHIRVIELTEEDRKAMRLTTE